jgi:HK97 family phage prohead protease
MWLNFEHEQGIRGIVGHGVELEDRGDGLHGSFRVHENADGDKALQLVREGLLGGLSLEFVAMRSRTVDGIVQRLRAHIDKVSLVRFPAYEGAQVLAVREQPLEEEEETPAPALRAEPMVDELAERLAALELEPLRRIATTGKTWDGSPARFTDDQYKRSALFCRGGGDPPKADCSLPVLEPDGTLNTNALGAAAAALAGARGGVRGASPQQKASAARKLIRYYNAAGLEPPASLIALARS